jgi:hypothetical protein
VIIEVTVKTSMASTACAFLLRLALAGGLVLGFAMAVRGGGPKCRIKITRARNGQALTWPLGQIAYFTDQGDLSPILPNASANNLVAGAFSVWTSVRTAALAAVRAGSLAEDVNGSNVIVNGDGTISMPTDVESTAVGLRLGLCTTLTGRSPARCSGRAPATQASVSSMRFSEEMTITGSGQLSTCARRN